MDENFLKNITILIVEDNQNDLDILVGALNRYFNKILTANNGLDALKIYKENNEIDIIISDIEMPKMNGLELLKSIRFTDIYTPFIIISAKIESEILMEAINLNVSSYVLKPIDIKTIIEKIDILCEKKYFEFRLKRKQDELNNYISSVDKAAAIFKLKRDGSITYMNELMLEISEYQKKDLEIGLNFDDIIHPDIPKIYIQKAWEDLDSGEIWRGNTKFISKNKETFYLQNTIFKSSDSDDEYIIIAYLTTKENLEKRDFHKKVLLSIKEFNLKEYGYKEEIKSLKEELSKTNMIDFEARMKALKEKILIYESQLKKYEDDIVSLNEKYTSMLQTKKDEINKYVDLIQVEKRKNEKIEEQNEALLEDRKILKNLNERLQNELDRRV